MSNRLFLFDTSNFLDFPVGGQVTSIQNFLRYVSELYPERISDIYLVGISNDPALVGKMQKQKINGVDFNFLPVFSAESDLSNVKQSIRLHYLLGLFRYLPLLKIEKTDCCYMHTPEAYLPIKLLQMRVPVILFVHGSYNGANKRQRFFKKAPWVGKLYMKYIFHVIKHSDHVFVLEKSDYEEYGKKYNKNISLVRNSIVCGEFFERKSPVPPYRILYAGRLSKVKNIGPAIEAINSYSKDCVFTIVGDGEERSNLERIAGERIKFVGAVRPDEVRNYMLNSDVLLMNSISEGLPMTQLEALSTELPIITTDVGSIGDVLSFGNDSEVTDGTVESIHRALDRILNDYQRYVQGAFETAQKCDYRIVNKYNFSVINSYIHWK